MEEEKGGAAARQLCKLLCMEINSVERLQVVFFI